MEEIRRCPLPEVAPRDELSLSASVPPMLRICSVGSKPNTIPVSIEIATANSNTCQSRRTSPDLAMATGAIAIKTRLLTQEMNSPRIPPRMASSTLSVRTCREIRSARPESATDCDLPGPVTHFAQQQISALAQAISNTKPTAPKSSRRVGRVSPVMRCCKGSRVTRPSDGNTGGNSFAACWPSIVICAAACGGSRHL